MSIHVALNHITHYRYDRLVALGPQIVRLRPAPHCRTPILSYSLRVEPAEHFINWQQDPFAQLPRAAGVPREDRASSRSTVDLVAEMAVYNPFDFFLEPSAEQFPVRVRAAWLAQELAPYLARRAADAAARRPTSSSIDRKPRRDDRLPGRRSTSGCSSDIRYLIRMEPGVQTPEETLDAGAAAPAATPAGCWCRLLRHLGLAARFVSGYLIQLTPDVKALDGPSGTERRLHRPARLVRGLPARRRLDRPRPDLGPARRRRPHPARLHARAVERRADQRRRRRVRGRVQPRDAVTRIYESPRVTKPYTDEQWDDDRWRWATRSTRPRSRRRAPDDGRRADVRVDRRPRRRRMEHRRARPDQARLRAPSCCARLRARLRRGRLPALRPGQVVSRRAAAALGARAATGAPTASRCWTRPGAVRRRTRSPTATRADDAERFITALADAARRRPTSYVQPGYEDVWYYLWRERRLPVNVDPFERASTTSSSATACAASSTQGLDAVVGYALPLQRATTDATGGAGRPAPGSCATSACT